MHELAIILAENISALGLKLNYFAWLKQVIRKPSESD